MEPQELSIAKAFTEMVKILHDVQSQLIHLSQAIITTGELIDQQFDTRVEEGVAAKLAQAIPMSTDTSPNGTSHTTPEVC